MPCLDRLAARNHGKSFPLVVQIPTRRHQQFMTVKTQKQYIHEVHPRSKQTIWPQCCHHRELNSWPQIKYSRYTGAINGLTYCNCRDRFRSNQTVWLNIIAQILGPTFWKAFFLSSGHLPASSSIAITHSHGMSPLLLHCHQSPLMLHDSKFLFHSIQVNKTQSMSGWKTDQDVNHPAHVSVSESFLTVTVEDVVQSPRHWCTINT